MSQNIDSISSVLDMTLSAAILTSQFREIAKKETLLRLFSNTKNIKQVAECPIIIQHIQLVHLLYLKTTHSVIQKHKFTLCAVHFLINDN